MRDNWLFYLGALRERCNIGQNDHFVIIGNNEGKQEGFPTANVSQLYKMQILYNTGDKKALKNGFRALWGLF